MKVILVVTKDTVTGEAVTAIQANKNEAEAKRQWGMAIQEIEKNPGKTPYKDFQLYKVADFNTESLEIVPDNKFLCSAGEFLKG